MADTGGDRGGNSTRGRARVRARGARVLASELLASPVARFGRPLKIIFLVMAMARCWSVVLLI
jgi:hypothetical protein